MSNVRRLMNRQALAAAALWLSVNPMAHAQAMYEVPRGALEVRHVALQPGVYEQDSFVLEEPYPSTSALEHYERVFAKWQSCSSKGSQWESFGDVSAPEPKFHHQLIRHWVNPSNNTAIIVALRYSSAGAQFRSAPDNPHQGVFVLRLKVKNAKSALAQTGVICG